MAALRTRTSTLPAWAALGAVALGVATAAAAQSGPEYGPPPTEREFYEAADRAAHRLFRSRIQRTDWREPRLGSIYGRVGYIACGDVRLRDRPEPVTIAAVWRRGDIQPLLMTWRYDEQDPFADQADLPMWVLPVRELPDLCSGFTGERDEAQQQEGEEFAWAPPSPFPAGWRQMRRETRRFPSPDQFGRTLDCVRVRTREGRRYRVTVEAEADTSLSILTDRECSGSESVIRWNDNASPTDRNPQVEFDGDGVVYAYVLARPGSSGGAYTLTVEEARVQ